MFRCVLKWALATCVGAIIAAESFGQTPAAQSSSSLDHGPTSPVAAPGMEFPDSTWVELSITDWGPLQKAATGTTVPLVVTEDVMVDGVKAIGAGTMLTGIIAKQKQGTHWLGSDGRMQIEARDLKIAAPIPIYRRSVLEALNVPSTADFHALKVLGISTASGFVLGLLPNPQNTDIARLTNGAICAGIGLFIGAFIESPPPPLLPVRWPSGWRRRLHLHGR